MTPNDIDVLMHYFCMCVPHPRLSFPAVQQAILKMLEKLGMSGVAHPERYVPDTDAECRFYHPGI